MRARPLLTILGVWALLAVLRLWAGWDFVVTGRSADPDSVMRLLQVRDWVAGQGWFDLAQYRIGPAGGVAMHWTRAGDLIPGALIAVMTPVAGSGVAERVAMVATPLILLGGAVWLTLGIVRALAGRAAPLATAAVMATSLGTMTVFAPGNIDHHGLQLVLVLALVRAALAVSGHGMAAAAVLSLVVGIETVPVVFAVLGTTGLRWLQDPHAHRVVLRDLGIGLIAGSIAALVVFMPHPWPRQCDAWTLPVFWLSMAVGTVFTAAAAVTARPLSVRIAAPFAIALIGGAIVYSLYPACRVHPAGTDPLLWRYWMNHVSENASLRELVADEGVGAVFLFLGATPVVLLASAWRAVRYRDARWLPVIAATAAALVIAVLHVRGQAMLGGLTACLAAALIARASARPGVGRIAAWVAFMPISWLLLGAAFARPATTALAQTQAACRAPAVMTALDAIAPTTLVVPMMVEPHVLAATPHRSLAATYHRNVSGNHAMIAAMIGTSEAARSMLTEQGVGAVLYCPGYDTDRYARENPGSLAAALAAYRAPVWLRPTATLPGNIRLYTVAAGGR